MAIVRCGSGVVQFSGSLGGNTFARTPFGCNLRTRRKPLQKKSVRQQLNKTVFSSLSSQWRHSPMTEARRQAWKQYADGTIMQNRLGEPIHLTGYQHFIRSNIARLKCDLNTILDGPGTPGLPMTPNSVYCRAGQTGQFIFFVFTAFEPGSIEADAAIYFEMAVPVKCHQRHTPPHWRFVAYRHLHPPPPYEVNVGSASPPWRLIYKQKIFTRGRVVRADGRVSNAFYAPPRLVAMKYDDPEPACL